MRGDGDQGVALNLTYETTVSDYEDLRSKRRTWLGLMINPAMMLYTTR